MAGEKTEQPTPKRLRDARKKGQVFKSTEIVQALLFMTAVGVLAAGGQGYITVLRELMTELFQPQMLTGTMPADELLRRTGYAWAKSLILLAPLLSALVIVSAGANFLQVKSLFAPEVIKPKLEKLDPMKGLQNLLFKPRTYLELAKTLVKFTIISVLAYAIVKGSLRDIVLTARAEPLAAAQFAAGLMFNLLLKAGAVFLLLGAADYLLQKRIHMKEMMMTKDEVRRESKEDEGDPHIKQMRRHLHEELLAQGMIEKVPQADVVVVNPTHLAIAVQYDEKTMNAPVVTAKGQLRTAERIVAIAKSHRVPIVRDVPLAHSLYAVETGSEVPEDMYEAVAEVLNWVYQLAKAGEEYSKGTQ